MKPLLYIIFFLPLVFGSRELKAQLSVSDSTQDKQILNIIRSGAYSVIKVDSGGLFNFDPGSYDSLNYSQKRDSIVMLMYHVPTQGDPVFTGKIIYGKSGQRLFYESQNQSLRGLKTIIFYDEKGREIRELTNGDSEYYANYSKEGYNDSLFLLRSISYDKEGNLETHIRLNRIGAIESLRNNRFFYFDKQSFMIESDFKNDSWFPLLAVNTPDDMSDEGKIVCGLDTVIRKKECSILKYFEKDTVCVSKDVYYYDVNCNTIKQEHFSCNEKMIFTIISFYDSKGNDTLSLRTLSQGFDSSAKKYLMRNVYNSNGFQILHEHFIDSIKDFALVWNYDKDGHIVYDSSYSRYQVDNIFDDKNTWSYDSRGNLLNKKSFKAGKLMTTERYTYYYKK